MGAWGSGLYQNDTTCDVRDTYMGFLQEQLSSQEAYEKTLEIYQEFIGDEDDEPLLWFALAETQWKVGRLMPEVKARALEWIEKGGGVAIWEESGTNSTGWKRTLEKLRLKLETEQPKEKRIRKPQIINQNLWSLGDVYAYQFHKEASKKCGVYGKFVLIQKMGEEQFIPPYIGEDEDLSKLPVMMRIHVFDKLFDYTPALKDVEEFKLLPIGQPTWTGEIAMSVLIELDKKKDYPTEQLTFVGNMQPPANSTIKESAYPVLWYNFEAVCGNSFQFWQGKEYEEVEAGVFRYTKPE
jgi:hypothetical protein